MYSAIDLIAKIATKLIRNSLDHSSDTEGQGVARFLLDRLNGQQVATICQTILDTPDLANHVEIKVPIFLVKDYNLPEGITTSEKIVFWRNAPCNKSVLVLANTHDDQDQSLQDISRIGANELKAEKDLWIDVLRDKLILNDDSIKIWKTAIKSLPSINFSLEQFSQYVADTYQIIESEGLPIVTALGFALPALHIPRDSNFFEAIPENKRKQSKKWESLFQQAINKRACFLLKQDPNMKILEPQELQQSFEKVKDKIPFNIHSIIEKFINSPNQGKWSDESKELSKFEWINDNIASIFTNIKQTKQDLGSLTISFFENQYPDILTRDEELYLTTFKKRKVTSDITEDDQEFYEKHHRELDLDKRLKAKWDKFVYGQPIECSDLLVGLVAACERLFVQAGNLYGEKKLLISTDKGSSKKKWLELNTDVGLYFYYKYKGLEKLTQPFVVWEDKGKFWPFNYLQLIQEQETQGKKKNSPNTSTARSALEIKFYLTLQDIKKDVEIAKIQLIWKGNPQAIGLKLRHDLNRLDTSSSPCLLGEVSRDSVSKKGNIQGVCLSDVSTLMPVYGKDRGSLISKYEKRSDLNQIFVKELKNAVKDNRISQDKSLLIQEKWKNFVDKYKQAIHEWLIGEGIASQSLYYQSLAYQELLETLLLYAQGDINRQRLYIPLLQLGCISVIGGTPAAIIAPWHPLRMCAIYIKAVQVSELIKTLLTSREINLGDSRLFFNDLRLELTHPYYPEIGIGVFKQETKLLSIIDSLNDYSLLEEPTGDLGMDKDDDPSEAVQKLMDLVERYLTLLPHETTHLGLVLIECNSIKLPNLLLNKLSEYQEEKEESLGCSVWIHNDTPSQLTSIYQQLIASSEFEGNSFLSMQNSKDFMAQLRIGILSNDLPNQKLGKFADIVFLQDVVSQQAKIIWEKSDLNHHTIDLLTHVPARWSKKRPTYKDELKSTVYLICPIQPKLGLVYADIIYSLLQSTDIKSEAHFLPARQILFSTDKVKDTFQKAHRIGEWVINYDDLLDRRQLLNQGVKVIKYQQERTSERNLLVSSNSSMDLLQVLVKHRLDSLKLNIDESEKLNLTNKLIEEATELSGDIVLRAAKCGHFASELLGVALSKALILSELGETKIIGWYFLDDYASWLGQKEEQIADILAIHPFFEGNNIILKIIVSESKYIDASNSSNACKTSQKQLRDTVERIRSALFSPGRLDRELWLSRLADLLLDRIELSSAQVNSNKNGFSLEKLRESVRQGKVMIDLIGYSHVFISGPIDSKVSSERLIIPKTEKCFQEIYSVNDVKNLILNYNNKINLFKYRCNLQGETEDISWPISNPLHLSEKINWSIKMDLPSTVIEQEIVLSEVSSLSEPLKKKDIQINQSKKSLEKLVVKNTEKVISSISENIWQNNEELNTWIEENSYQSDNSNEEDWVKEVQEKTKLALMSYNLQAQILGTRLTPNALLLRFKGSDRLKVDDLERKRSELLTTHGLNIINISAQPGEIVIFVARPQRQVISLAEVWQKRQINQSLDVNLSLLIGVREIDGESLYLNLGSSFANLQQHSPHTLIAGTTGSGKSILLRNMILDICATNSPNLVNIYLIDAKSGTDYFALEDLPHLRKGIIIDQDIAIKTFETIVEEMDRRYQLFKTQRVSNLFAYNEKVKSDEKLPVIFLIHDEFADWMLIDDYKKSVSSAVQRLGVKARASGIHLIFAAQRPDNQVFPMQLRDNLGNRLILKVESEGTSEITLGEKGAEKLLGKGHLSAKLGEPNIVYAQVPFLSDDDFSMVADMIANHFKKKIN